MQPRILQPCGAAVLGVKADLPLLHGGDLNVCNSKYELRVRTLTSRKGCIFHPFCNAFHRQAIQSSSPAFLSIKIEPEKIARGLQPDHGGEESLAELDHGA